MFPVRRAARWMGRVSSRTNQCAIHNRARPPTSLHHAAGRFQAAAGHGGLDEAAELGANQCNPQHAHLPHRTTQQVGSKLRLDMEKAGIHLPAAQQARMQGLMAAGGNYAAAFNAALVRPAPVRRALPLSPSIVSGQARGGRGPPRSRAQLCGGVKQGNEKPRRRLEIPAGGG